LSWKVVGRKFNNLDRKFCAVSQNMEVHALRLAIPELRALGKIIEYVHDNDAKAKNAIKAAGWNIIEKLDPGHSLKSFDRKLINFNKDHENVLAEIGDRLRRFLKKLMYLDVAVDRGANRKEAKLRYWRNAALHFSGHHEGCPCQHDPKQAPPAVWSRAGNAESMQLLRDFLKKTEKVVELVDGEFSTQLNESINRSKTSFADKDRQWRGSWEARMACAVLDRNVENWRLTLYDRLNLPELSGTSLFILENLEKRRLARKVMKTSTEYRNKQRAKRKAERKEAKQAPPAKKLDYKPSPWVSRK
jgi:hypothetical protein